MDYIKLGTTGLDVSPVAIGAMTYGEPDRGHPAWSLGEDEARPLIKHALDAGINFFDTANLYSLGSSEEILGRALRDFADRDSVVIATKLRHAMRSGELAEDPEAVQPAGRGPGIALPRRHDDRSPPAIATSWRSPSCAAGSTGCLWPSSSPLLGSPGSGSATSSTVSMTGSNCSSSGAAAFLGSRACARRCSGRTTC